MNNKTFNRTLVTAALPYANGVCTSVTWPVFTFLPTSMCATFVCANKKSSLSAVLMSMVCP